MPSTACWSSDARFPSAPPDHKRGGGNCARTPGPCNTATQAANPASKASGSISMNTRRKVSCEGMPFASSRKVLSQASLLRPYSAMSFQLSAQAITAHTAITSTSIRRCSTLPEQRGSSTAPKYRPSFSIDMPRSPAIARARHHTAGPGRRKKSHA